MNTKNKIASSLRSKAFFLLTLPIFFIYSGYNELFGFLPAKFILINTLYLLGFVLLIFGLFFLLYKNSQKSALFTFFITLINLTFGYLHDVLKQIGTDHFFVRFSLLIPILLLLFIALFFVINRHKSGFENIFSFLNLLFIILILSEIPNSVKRFELDKSVDNLIDFRFNAYNDYKPVTVLPDSLKPDIYFLVFDELASTKTIQTISEEKSYNLDSTLSNQGFYIAKKSKSNYNWTIFSLTSTLNMEYLPSWIEPAMNDPKVYFWGGKSFLKNSLFKILHSQGYIIKNYQPISLNNKDWKYESLFQGLSNKHYFFKTLPGRIFRDLFWNYKRINNDYIKKHQMQLINTRNSRKLALFDSTILLVKKSCVDIKEPKFIYGHFMIPHDPFIVDSHGELKKPEETIYKTKDEHTKAYLEQIEFTQKKIIEIVRYIQKTNKKNTIIILEGDHGFRPDMTYSSRYSFDNFSSYYFPDEDYTLLYDSISPVNSFRVVLNKYFKSDFLLLKDTCIIVSSGKEIIKKSEKIHPAHTPSTPNQ